MKIENSIKTTPGVPSSKGPSTPSTSGQRAGDIAGTHDANGSGGNVRLSVQLQNIEKDLANGEVFDTARVAEIKQAISEGRFSINPDKVADRLLETVRDLIRTRQG